MNQKSQHKHFYLFWQNLLIIVLEKLDTHHKVVENEDFRVVFYAVPESFDFRIFLLSVASFSRCAITLDVRSWILTMPVVLRTALIFRLGLGIPHFYGEELHQLPRHYLDITSAARGAALEDSEDPIVDPIKYAESALWTHPDRHDTIVFRLWKRMQYHLFRVGDDKYLPLYQGEKEGFNWSLPIDGR